MELQKFIDDNNNYINRFKDEGFKVVRYKNLILVKNYYDKPLDFSSENDYWKMYCRGAIIDKDINKVVCLPPVKSVEIKSEDILPDGEIQYLIDGTMVNLFYNRGSWIIATRGGIGGHNKWTDTKNFRDMFNDCCNINCCNINYDNLDKDCSYSFVMRHKDNRNISPIKVNELYLVEIYKYHLNKDFERLTHDQYPSDILKINNESSFLMETIANDYKIKGYTIKQGNKRYKILNPLFEKVRNLKPNMNNNLLNYIILRQNGDLDEYLKYYPEHKKLFGDYRLEIHNLSNKLYNCYKNCFIFKKIEKKDIPYHLKPFVNDIHKKYQKDKTPTTWRDIKDYIHNLPPKRIVFALNYS